jgi:hypothetical protein
MLHYQQMISVQKHWAITFSIALLLITNSCVSDPGEQRVVVIGDLHADIGVAREAFQLAGATSENDDWVGGDLIIVQLGDLIGRSFEEREVLDFILDVREKAKAYGGRVHALIGNHEVFAARLVFNWVDDAAFAAYEGIPDLKLNDPYLEGLTSTQRSRGAALMPGGHYARQIANFPTVLKLGDTIFVHGSVTPVWAKYGIDRINEEVSLWLKGHTDEPESSSGKDPGKLDDRVMWSRQFSDDVDEDDCRLLEESLEILGATRMIVAHTVHEEITPRCDEQVWAVDVGMSRAYGGEIQLLEISNDEVISIIRR